MGQDRGGFYSNTWIENLFGSDIQNAQSIHPEWQHRALGDRVPLARPDLLFGTGAAGHTDIVLLQPERAIGIVVGRFVLEPIGDTGTRVLFRESLQTQGPPAQGPGALRALVWDLAHFVMVHRMLEGIKERAEARSLVPVWVACQTLPTRRKPPRQQRQLHPAWRQLHPAQPRRARCSLRTISRTRRRVGC